MRLRLFGTEHCHLCDEAEALVTPIARARGLELVAVDVALDETLLALYGESVPVLQLESAREALYWPFDRAAVEAYLARGSAAAVNRRRRRMLVDPVSR